MQFLLDTIPLRDDQRAGRGPQGRLQMRREIDTLSKLQAATSDKAKKLAAIRTAKLKKLAADQARKNGRAGK